MFSFSGVSQIGFIKILLDILWKWYEQIHLEKSEYCVTLLESQNEYHIKSSENPTAKVVI